MIRNEKGHEQMKQLYCPVCGVDPEDRKVLSIRDAADLSGVSISTLYRWMRAGRLEWVYNRAGHRKVYEDSLLKVPNCVQQISGEIVDDVMTVEVR